MAKPYRALIVDDEQRVRSLTVRAMNHEQFICDEASDGDEAVSMCRHRKYDLVVTDLKMPGRNGYQLACDLLDHDDRPMIVVLTGVLEPRLAKDLYARGVEHIEFKPVDYDLFATRIKSLLARQVQAATPLAAMCDNGVEENQTSSPPSGQMTSITMGEVEARLKHLAGISPMSQAALDVVDVVHADDSDATQVAAAIARDASLAVEVLKLANSSFYNPSGERVVSLEQAVVRVGTRRVGELALATTVLSSLTTSVLPWMDVDLAWRRSIAAGLAVDLLVDAAELCSDHEGLFLCALMHGLGRIALGTVFPETYRSMVEKCRASNSPLVDLEREVFPETAANSMLRLLSIWNVPTAACEPLKHLSDEYTALSHLDELSRKQVELLKLSVLVGQIAVGEWESWDLVELPPRNVLERLNVVSVSEIVEQTRADLFEVVNFRKRSPVPFNSAAQFDNGHSAQLSYCQSPSEHIDFLFEITRCLNIASLAAEHIDSASGDPILINKIGVPPHELAASINAYERRARKRLVVTDADAPNVDSPDLEVIRLPCSFATLRTGLQTLLQPNVVSVM